ncbi:hypothetical protein OQA88_3363 [Cercophora sp. LCS_1]
MASSPLSEENVYRYHHARFEALVKLFHLRSLGKTAPKYLEHDGPDGVTKALLAGHTLVAGGNGGHGSVSALMIDRMKGVGVLVAADYELQPSDEKFLADIARHLREIGRRGEDPIIPVHKPWRRTNDMEVNTLRKEKLYDIILGGHEERIRDAVSDLRQRLQAYIRECKSVEEYGTEHLDVLRHMKELIEALPDNTGWQKYREVARWAH